MCSHSFISSGKIYHDIGMLYSSEKCYQSASECFEHSYHALEEVNREDKDKTLEAVVLLNMGGALNHLALYERAIGFHNSAIKKFGKLTPSAFFSFIDPFVNSQGQ